MVKENFVRMFEDSFRQNWDLEAYTDYETKYTMTYAQVAEQVEKLHLLFQQCGIEKNDKVSLIGRNSAHWAVAYVATITYGAVIVPILQDFRPDDVHHILKHSDSKLLFTADYIWDHLDENELGQVRAVISLTKFKPLAVINSALPVVDKETGIRMTLTKELISSEVIQQLFDRKFKGNFQPDCIRYDYKDNEEIASINYTSGTTGFSKGVMTTGRALASNAVFGHTTYAYNNPTGKLLFKGDRMVTFLPLAHAYGCAFDFLGNTTVGGHTYFITRVPTPKVLLAAFAEVKPTLILSVPLIIEKIYRKQIQPMIAKPPMSWVLKVPFLDEVVLSQIRQKLVGVFGGCFEEVIVGGAAMNAEVESFFRKIKFPLTIGYGMTECAPLISYCHWSEFRQTSCGTILDNMEVRITDKNAEGIGEIEVRGDNVMLGYYKNEEATRATFTEDGWLRTGDLGYVDEKGNIFIKGRSKTMMLGSNGQNIYPEELEDKLNNMPYVMESIVVQRGEKIVALVYPDMDACDKAGFTQNDIQTQMENMRKEVNKQLAAYEQINSVEVQAHEFEKTPKNSIKRYMYK
ncbi:MAG: AMP-binding protein [Paludibacteraceae bacterium]|nr:AMP-binding protein [Paludibacteraceae bacterium]MBQ9705976.1 AMP-binding protein [Paludibacteraceae bacterium]